MLLEPNFGKAEYIWLIILCRSWTVIWFGQYTCSHGNTTAQKYFFLKHATVDYAELKRIWDDKVGLTRLLLHTKEFPRATVGTRASIEWLAIQLVWVESWPREQSSDDHPEDALSFHNRIWWSQLEFVTLNLFGGPTTCCPPKALAVCGFLVVTRQWLKIASSWQ